LKDIFWLENIVKEIRMNKREILGRKKGTEERGRGVGGGERTLADVRGPMRGVSCVKVFFFTLKVFSFSFFMSISSVLNTVV